MYTHTHTYIQSPESIPLVLFRNGLMFFNGPGRLYSEATTQMVVRDLTDGYFPWELKERYPQGVPILVHDRRWVWLYCVLCTMLNLNFKEVQVVATPE